MTVKLLTQHYLENLSLKGGCTCSSESTYVNMPHCWKSHIMAHIHVLSFVFTELRGTPDIQGTSTAHNLVGNGRVQHGISLAWNFVGPDLGLSCWQRLSADGNSRQMSGSS